MAKNAKMKYPIQTKHVAGIAKYPYTKGIAKPQVVVLHDTGNDKSTIDGEISYMSRSWQNAFVHAWADADKIVETANTDYLCWGAGPNINTIALQIELVHEHNKDRFLKSIDRWLFWAAFQCYWYDIKPTDATDDGKGTIWTHEAVSKFKGGTDHVDPMPYIKKRGKELGVTITWAMIMNKIIEYVNALNKGDSTKVLMIGEVQKATAKPAVKKEEPAKKAPAKITYKTYTVPKGMSLSKISKAYNIPVDEIKKINGLKTDKIFIGQVLRIMPLDVWNERLKKKKPKVAEKQKAPANPNLRTKKEMLDRIKWYKGQMINFDGWFGAQCADLSTDYIWYMTKGKHRAWGNARDLINNKFPDGWKIYANTKDFIPAVGDIVVYSKDWFDNAYGHVALVYADPTADTQIVIEQNWDGKANTPATTRKDNYYGVSHFIRPPYVL